MNKFLIFVFIFILPIFSLQAYIVTVLDVQDDLFEAKGHYFYNNKNNFISKGKNYYLSEETKHEGINNYCYTIVLNDLETGEAQTFKSVPVKENFVRINEILEKEKSIKEGYKLVYVHTMGGRGYIKVKIWNVNIKYKILLEDGSINELDTYISYDTKKEAKANEDSIEEIREGDFLKIGEWVETESKNLHKLNYNVEIYRNNNKINFSSASIIGEIRNIKQYTFRVDNVLQSSKFIRIHEHIYHSADLEQHGFKVGSKATIVSEEILPGNANEYYIKLGLISPLDNQIYYFISLFEDDSEKTSIEKVELKDKMTYTNLGNLHFITYRLTFFMQDGTVYEGLVTNQWPSREEADRVFNSDSLPFVPGDEIVWPRPALVSPFENALYRTHIKDRGYWMQFELTGPLRKPAFWGY